MISADARRSLFLSAMRAVMTALAVLAGTPASRTWVYDPSIRVPPEPCEPALELVRPAGEVPHYLPGTNPYLAELTEKFNIPLDALRGGAAGLYPEYRKGLRDRYVPPARTPVVAPQGARP